jgi:hypothetical protein
LLRLIHQDCYYWVIDYYRALLPLAGLYFYNTF